MVVLDDNGASTADVPRCCLGSPDGNLFGRIRDLVGLVTFFLT